MVQQRVLGVVGTFVVDRIVGLTGRAEPIEALGGLAYSLAGAAAAIPEGWRLLPLARVGADAYDVVGAWLQETGLPLEGLVQVREPNNRVELRYHDDARRTERLTGGVSGWDGARLAATAERCDALLVNFISGHELTLTDATAVRRGFGGRIYADLHSLFLGVATDGRREPRPLPDWERWMTCFDAVQLNADEMDLLRGDTPLDTQARRVLGLGPNVLTCTTGADGALCWSTVANGFGAPRDDGSVVRHEIAAHPVTEPDPTGCGDVWAGAMCCRLLAGDSVPEAAREASRLAASAARRSGVSGLAQQLRNEAEDGRAKTREEDS